MAEALLAICKPQAHRHMETLAIATLDPWSEAGHALGVDHARYGLTPPAEHMVAGHPLRLGWQAGRARFGRHGAQAASAPVRQWLALRLHAWHRGLHFEPLTVTPNHLAQLQVSHCPVTRELLPASAAVIARLCDQAGYAAGHLAQLSPRAAQALEGHGFEDLYEQARQSRSDTLNPHQAARLAVLRAFVTPLPHAQAAGLPLLVLPPNRLRLRNPIQGLQLLVTLLLAKSGWSKRLPQLEALMPSAGTRRELHAFFLCLMAKAIAAGRPGDALAKRWALEDAWRHPQVQAHWKRFALQLDADSSDALLARAVAAGLAPGHTQLHSDAQATEGWGLETQGYAPAPLRLAAPRAARRLGRTRLQVVAPTGVAKQLSLPIDA